MSLFKRPARLRWLGTHVMALGLLTLAGNGAVAGERRPALAPAVARMAQPSVDARQLTQWIVATGDHHGLPFAVLDKRAAMLHVFDRHGALQASSPVLLGLARGDVSVPGIGEREMADIRPQERITPAGRFDSEPGLNLQGEDVVWIDYDAGVSMHRVRTTNKAERRLERLATPTAADNRISYGCVNVPAAFYEAHIRPVLGRRRGVVYVLPETREAKALFGTTSVAAARR